MLWPHLWLVAVPYVILVPLTTQAVDYDYERVLELSLLFYEAQRSGKLPSDNRVTWRGDSALEDRGQQGEDLTGGYYDAGDFVKFGFTMASTTTLLAWGFLSYKEAYISAGQFNHGLNAMKWSADYFIKCHVSPNELYGQVGDFNLDHEFWGRPEELNMSRPAYKIDAKHPGSDLAGETAAALAAVSLVFRTENPKYADLCLEHARQLYTFASDFRGLYNEPIKGAAQYYDQLEGRMPAYVDTNNGIYSNEQIFAFNSIKNTVLKFKDALVENMEMDRTIPSIFEWISRQGLEEEWNVYRLQEYRIAFLDCLGPKLMKLSTDYGDELTWAAAWLYKATSESQYLDEAEHNYMKFRLKERPNEFFYNKKVAGVQRGLERATFKIFKISMVTTKWISNMKVRLRLANINRLYNFSRFAYLALTKGSS
ncbi:unnamed protein product [Timema podura]|uniref:cellulase n=1 Tax=Timema podura TaxID=61482 RepID=A0ABN7NKL0_TIMPD|nr:unnamed protein product [Timema podura]